MKRWMSLGIVVSVVWWWWLQPPTVDAVFKHMVFTTPPGNIAYRGVTFQAAWGDEVRHAGTVQFIDRAFYRAAPIFTHHVTVTTGEFNDPRIVTIRPINRDGNMSWRAIREPQGSLLVLHLIPHNKHILQQLKRLQAGTPVVFVGRVENDSAIIGSNGSWLRLAHENHQYMLLTAIETP